jgi:hypothetical protein
MEEKRMLDELKQVIAQAEAEQWNEFRVHDAVNGLVTEYDYYDGSFECSLFSEIEKLIEQFPGIQFLDATLKGTLAEVTFTSKCKNSLKALISCESSSPVWTTIHCFDHKKFEYITMFELEDLDKYVLALKSALSKITKN